MTEIKEREREMDETNGRTDGAKSGKMESTEPPQKSQDLSPARQI
jgi:hypothetical protein